jgi:hypothetical protein
MISRSLWEMERVTQRGAQLMAVAVTALCFVASGCAPATLQKHTVALSEATAPVVDQAAAAYNEANSIHQTRMDYDAVAVFEQDHSVEKLRIVHPLIPEDGLNVRLAVLKALQLYPQRLAAIENDTESPALDSASTSLGTGLANLGNTVLPASAATGSGATSTAPSPAISSQSENILITGANALGRFLASRIIKKDLQPKIVEMDPTIESLCKMLADEVGFIHDAETKDFDHVLDQQKQFLMDPNVKLSEVERRNEIMDMQKLVRQQADADAHLTELKYAIGKLALTHHALAAEAQGNNPESLKQKLSDLVTAGKSLGTFYSSLPAQQ